MSTALDAGLTHLHIAGRLTDRAIEMLFSGDELLFVMTMAHPGGMLFHDLAREALGDKNATALLTKDMIRDGVLMPDGSPVRKVADVQAVLRRAGNSLKHTSLEPVLDASAVYAIIASSCHNALDLGVLSDQQRVFMWWYFVITGGVTGKAWPEAEAAFPGLSSMTLEDQLSHGHAFLQTRKRAGAVP